MTIETSGPGVEVQHGLYRIIALEPTSQILKHLSSPGVKAINIISMILQFVYLFVNFYVAGTLPSRSLGLRAPWRLYALIFAEFWLSMVDILARFEQFIPLICSIKLKDRPRYRLLGDVVPKVDVCILACGEDVSIAMLTIAAAAAQDYPHAYFNLFLLDDGNSTELRDAVQKFNEAQMQRGHKQIQYLSRRKVPGVPSHFKAGNLNYGLQETQRLSGAKYLASLDVDMIVQPYWLRSVFPHLLLDDKVAIATPPQFFYNLPPRDNLAQGPGIFTNVVEPVKDGMGNAWCTGSGFIVRREVITGLGGWPTNSVVEDIMCSNIILAAGWKSVFVNEELQTGLVPDTLQGYLKQRMRWTSGNVQVAHAFKFFLPGQKVRARLTLAQRLSSGVVHSLKEYAAFLVFLSAILMPIAIFPTKNHDLTDVIPESSRHLLGWIFLLSYATSTVNNYVVLGVAGMAHLENARRAKLWVAPYTMLAVLRVHWPSAYVFFEPSGTVRAPMKERSLRERRPFLKRFLTSGTSIHLCYVVGAAIPLGFRIREYLHSGSSGKFFPFSGAILKLAESIIMVSTPLWYMAFPPTVAERADLLETDENRVTRPKPRDEKANYMWSTAFSAMWDVLVVLLCIN